MPHRIVTAAVTALTLAGGTPAQEPASPEPARVIGLESGEGQRLLTGESADHAALMAAFTPQLPSLCGPASAVTVGNALAPLGLDQDGFFTPEVEAINPRERADRIGFTLDELAASIRVRTGLAVQAFRAGPAEDEFSHGDFVAALAASQRDPTDAIIINFSRESLLRTGHRGGHFSPVGDFNAEEGMVLILDVSTAPGREKFWVSTEDIHAAMACVDTVSGRNRGWLVVRRPGE